ncbi:MAG: transposase, partial [Deltaproteobacteria bacterium]|nr:transposase [Deltaproteobacteria bacterium]
MPPVMLPASFVSLLQRLRPVFTAPSFANFVVLIAGFVHALGGHRLTDALRAAGPAATKHYTTYYRFLSHGRWSLDELGLALIELIVETFEPGVVELVLDDTLTRRTGKKVALASMHADPLLKRSGGRPFMSYGHVFVVLAVHVKVLALGKTGWALPVMFRLFEGSSQGGRADSPSDALRRQQRRSQGKVVRQRIRKTDREVVDGKMRPCGSRPDEGPLPAAVRPKKTHLGTELILRVAKRFPHLRFRVLADHLYNGKTVLHAVLSEVDNVHVVSRGRPNAALYEMPPPRRPGQKGRPRKKGERLLNPEQWAEAHPEAFRAVRVSMYGREVTLHVASFLGMAYRSLPGRLLRYVIAKDPGGIYRTSYILCTDTTLDDAEV